MAWDIRAHLDLLCFGSLLQVQGSCLQVHLHVADDAHLFDTVFNQVMPKTRQNLGPPYTAGVTGCCRPVPHCDAMCLCHLCAFPRKQENPAIATRIRMQRSCMQNLILQSKICLQQSACSLMLLQHGCTLSSRRRGAGMHMGQATTSALTSSSDRAGGPPVLSKSPRWLQDACLPTQNDAS